MTKIFSPTCISNRLDEKDIDTQLRMFRYKRLKYTACNYMLLSSDMSQYSVITAHPPLTFVSRVPRRYLCDVLFHESLLNLVYYQPIQYSFQI